MRFSILSNDPGFDPRRTRKLKRVTVDGREIPNVVTADEEQGYVDALIPDLARPGDFKRDPLRFENFLLERHGGKVVIEWRVAERDWDVNRKASGVKVQVGMTPDRSKVLVQVFSVVRPGAIKQGSFDPRDCPTEHALIQKAGMTGGYMAELLCDQFGDTIDPHEAARVAVEQAALMVADNRAVIIRSQGAG